MKLMMKTAMNTMSLFVLALLTSFQAFAAGQSGALFGSFYGQYKVESCREVKPTRGENTLQGCERKSVQVLGKPGAALYTDIVLSGDASKGVEPITFGMVNTIDDSSVYIEKANEIAYLKSEYLSDSGNVISEIIMKDAGQNKVSLRLKTISFGWKDQANKEIASNDVEWILIPLK